MRKTAKFTDQKEALDIIKEAYPDFTGETLTIRLDQNNNPYEFQNGGLERFLNKDKSEQAEHKITNYKHRNGARIDIVKIPPEVITPAEYDEEGKAAKEAVLDARARYQIVYPSSYKLPAALEYRCCRNKEELKDWIKENGLDKELDLRLSFDKLIEELGKLNIA